jgi:hypothetical protein
MDSATRSGNGQNPVVSLDVRKVAKEQLERLTRGKPSVSPVDQPSATAYAA